MTQSLHPIFQDGNDPEGATSLTRVTLLQEKHWSFLRKRYRMTSREVQIAKKICAGLSNEEIAKALRIKSGTVKTHLRNIYRKTWVHNKISMLLRFVEDTNVLTSSTY
jgi:DNA-binding NarL/FixJ family response regulator